MNDPSFAWLLNLDAELELAAGPSYSPRRNVELAMAAQREKTSWLTGTESSFFPHEVADANLRGAPLLPWSPTWRARRIAEKSGRFLLSLTNPETLRVVSDKAFVLRSGAYGPASRALVLDPTELISLLGLYRERGLRARVKRRFGAQGRGQRTLREPLGDGDAKFLEDGFRSGGFLVEPEFASPRESSLHGMLLGDEVILGRACRLEVDSFGSVTSIKHLDEALSETTRALIALAEPVVASLRRDGYSGPFGIDFLETEGARFVSDINPRFTLGWSIGFAENRDPVLGRFVEACERARK